MSSEWFESFDAIPGVVWQPLTAVDRAGLKGAHERPTIQTYEGHDGTRGQFVKWTSLDRQEYEHPETSQSPSSQHAHPTRVGETDIVPTTVAKRVSEALALPGTRKDYHFIILGACDALHGARRSEPRVFGWIEKLCLADISMMEQGPELVFAEDHWGDTEAASLALPSVHRLAGLYVHEGFVAAAADLERRLIEIGGGRPAGEETISRQRTLLEEDGR